MGALKTSAHMLHVPSMFLVYVQSAILIINSLNQCYLGRKLRFNLVKFLFAVSRWGPCPTQRTLVDGKVPGWFQVFICYVLHLQGLSSTINGGGLLHGGGFHV